MYVIIIYIHIYYKIKYCEFKNKLELIKIKNNNLVSKNKKTKKKYLRSQNEYEINSPIFKWSEITNKNKKFF